MTNFVLVAHIDAEAAHHKEIGRELIALAAETRKEPGCLRYQLCRDLDLPGSWLIYEIWQSEDHWRAHLETPHFVRFKNDVLPSKCLLRADKLIERN